MKRDDLEHSGFRHWHQAPKSRECCTGDCNQGRDCPLPFATSWGDVVLSVALGIVIAAVLFLSI